ncbi:TPA: restriction endonuclease subunit S [Klebsiella michiganensis]|uniref:restriction endonuclease subunit S n=1 Tax=Klebsiella pneumoniae TaxID=573 RepID=UPI00190A7069|nr:MULTISPECIES: restriction endonuclease subunit S [Klebsiella]HBQ5769537.1 restriction endonuclease subunit S [Klebsiella pneumoniae subsp. pneumoniae]MBK4130891.1 restriction endonuclease subunit S [Klebsiella michiganensis]MDU7324871.1 restriction endonuclease subunit S [Klebsiella michiganensis]HBQ5805283.1 restriction endonuclease subunit S [Klebsiella pneumoniae subsp. pneumoniae]HBS7523407.1 restriction endonuclease subunit S [Klebsiella pneumoniae]
MSQYRAYPAYKDSGVEWIGQVPEHWKVARVKRLASLRNERRNDVSTDTIYIGLEDVEAGSGQYKPTNGSSRQSEDSTVGIFYEGDVLYGKLRPYLRKAIISEMAGCCSTEFLVLRAEKTEPRWLQEWLLTPDVTHQIVSGCEGAKMPRADWGHIGSIEVVYPDQPEQAKILTSLDRETARIDALIEKKTRFIELLNEKRQALITHAVTKGLDPNVKMKDSGIEWIGQVPEHWEVKPFKYILSAPMSYGANESAESDDPNHPRYIRITDLTENGILREDTFKTLPWDKAYSYLLSDGDILLARSGATVGKSFLYRETNGAACFAGYLIKASCDEEKALPKYIYAYLQSHSYWEYISGSNIQSTIQNVSAEKYSSMVLPVPQREEQATIVATLDRETARIDALISKAEQSITLLKERRAAFITAAVTGQIDLRGKQ